MFILGFCSLITVECTDPVVWFKLAYRHYRHRISSLGLSHSRQRNTSHGNFYSFCMATPVAGGLSCHCNLLLWFTTMQLCITSPCLRIIYVPCSLIAVAVQEMLSVAIFKTGVWAWFSSTTVMLLQGDVCVWCFCQKIKVTCKMYAFYICSIACE
jgi:hypothetical protein